MEARLSDPSIMLHPKSELSLSTRLFRWGVRSVIRTGTSLVCRIDGESLKKIPAQGPLILYSNHIGSLEVPLLVALVEPRPVTGLVKVETWDKPFMAWLFTLWGAIPIRRGEADMQAMRQALEALAKGWIVAVAPEGTRNRNGKLRRGQPGIVTLALRSGAPLLPMAHWGGEEFKSNLKRLKRTDFHIRVGEPFKLETNGERVTREVRQELADEVMLRLARLMPEEYRGVYQSATSGKDEA